MARALLWGGVAAVGMSGVACEGCGSSSGPGRARDALLSSATASSPVQPEVPVNRRLALALASATPENPLRPSLPAGEVVRNSAGQAKKLDMQLDQLRLPAGFSIELYTDRVPKARSLERGGKGIVYVSTRREDKVYAVVDRDADGAVDDVFTVASGLDTPNGIAYVNGDLFIAEVSRVTRLRGIDQALAAPPKPELVTKALPSHGHHGWRYMRHGPDGMLYITIGAPCNVCLNENPVLGSIVRLSPSGGEPEVYASGVRNSVGMAFHPVTNQLWFTDNGRDRLGEDLPPGELNRVETAGTHFGFPHCHGGKIVDPEFGQLRRCVDTVAPARNLGAHVAPLGFRFYRGKMFPKSFHHAAIIAEHGSWNRSTKNGYRVMTVRLDNNRPLGYEPLLDGFVQDNRVSGRPVDVEELPDGSLLVSDDWQGAIYRITYSAPEENRLAPTQAAPRGLSPP